jgi:hypothetical protein
VQKVISAQNLFTRKLFTVYTLHRFASFGILQFIARKLENTVNIISSFQESHMASLDLSIICSSCKNFHKHFLLLTLCVCRKNIQANIFYIILSKIFLARFINTVKDSKPASFGVRIYLSYIYLGSSVCHIPVCHPVIAAER